jgi:SPP1 gp7 family putative phage head morphogenesis protein
VVDTLDGEFSDFFDSKISVTGSIIVSQAINRARDDVFTTMKEDISVYQYSAILDNKTCDLCEPLDGTVVDESEYSSTAYEPPLHEWCRCIWIAIKKDQTDIPDVTGFPDISEEVAAKQSLCRDHKHKH